MKKLIYKIYNSLFNRKEILNRIDLFIDSRKHHFSESLNAFCNNDMDKYEYHKEKWEHYKLLVEENFNKLIF